MGSQKCPGGCADCGVSAGRSTQGFLLLLSGAEPGCGPFTRGCVSAPHSTPRPGWYGHSVVPRRCPRAEASPSETWGSLGSCVQSAPSPGAPRSPRPWSGMAANHGPPQKGRCFPGARRTGAHTHSPTLSASATRTDITERMQCGSSGWQGDQEPWCGSRDGGLPGGRGFCIDRLTGVC